MSEHEERHGVTSLTPRVTDLARTSIEAAADTDIVARPESQYRARQARLHDARTQ